MKQNEAPEKIYLTKLMLFAAPTISGSDNDVEYTRTDVLVKKAVEWLSANADKYIWYSDYAENIGDDTCGMNDDFIEDFKKYMNGESNK